MKLNDLDPELREKALACKTSDELVELAKESGIPMTDEQLASISGAANWETCTDNWCHDDDIW
ncbi:MAG: Nif11-like leader peptide family natural product precursor [Coriobacteriales bacterium]|nr:Nif11-like leader peptide family natural product precursor [Coriobacteriales bacterium]